MFQATVSGLENIEKDYEAFMPRVDKAIEAGLFAVANDMKASLIQHVENDVYDEYKPISYERTYEMKNRDNMNTDVNGRRLVFTYQFDTESNPPYYTNSDDVIRAIQDGKEHGRYLWNVYKRPIPPRPFWDNFVAEQFLDGKAEESFVAGINARYRDLDAKVTAGATKLDGNESDDLHGLPEHGIVDD